jgi:hypothetical protein
MLGWSLRHHGMVSSQVADGRDGLQLLRVAAIVLNKESRRADQSLTDMRVRVGLTTSRRKKNKIVTECYIAPPTLTKCFDKRRKLWKMDVRFGT